MLLAGVAVYLRKRSRPAALACAALAAAVWITSTGVFSDALLRPLEYAYGTPAAPAGDVIVVLGGGVYDAAGAFSAGELLAPASLARLSAAALLQKKTGLPVIVSGGPVFSSLAEADAAGAYLEERGVPAGAIIKEKISRDTAENAAFTRKVCLERGYKKIMLLTSAYHMPRAVFLFKRAGFEAIVPFPVSRATIKGEKIFHRDLTPGNYAAAARAMNEYLGLLFYRLVSLGGEKR